MAESEAMANPIDEALDRAARDKMSAAFDTPGNRVARTYAIVTQWRSGSTLLADMLRKRGAGVPFEYFNPRYRKAFCDRLGVDSATLEPDRYMELLRECRTSSDGIFGIKCMHNQLLSVFVTPQTIATFLGKFDKLVILSRRNYLSQAISTVIAEQTGAWSSDRPIEDSIAPHFDADAISQRIAWFSKQRRIMSRILLAVDRPKLNVTYENILASLPSTWMEVQAFLGLGLEPMQTAASSLRRQAGVETQMFAQRYLRYLEGVAES